MTTQFGIKLALPPVGAADVATRELSISVNGADPNVKTVVGHGTESEELVFNQDDQVSVTLCDIDTSNNRSQPSVPFTFKVVDDVAPPQPGALGVLSKRQIDPPAAPPAPPAAP